MLFIDRDAERRVISAMLNSETACIEAVDRLKDDDFYDSTNRDIYVLASDLFVRGVRPTFVEILKEGMKLGYIEGIQKHEEVKNIADAYIDDANILYWISRVQEASKGRKVERLLNLYTARMQEEKDIKGLISDISSDFFDLAMGITADRIETPAEIADIGIQLLEERIERYRRLEEECRLLGEVPLEGVPTGIKTLDRMTLGMKAGDLVILGAETGHGKTAFAMNVARAAAVENGNNILYVNTEMSREQIARRWGAILSDVALSQIQAGSTTDEQKETVVQAYNRLRKSGFYTCSVPDLTPVKLDVLARKAKMQNDIKLLILDYVGRMDKIQPDLAEWQVLEQIIKTQKLLAQTLGIACLVLVQLNPDGSLQGAKRMENECDLMLKLLPVDEEGQRRVAEARGKEFEEFNYRIWINKARDAQSGISIPLVFDKPKQYIREAEEVEDKWASIGTYRRM